MRIDERIAGGGEPAFSFEFFPPKTPDGEAKLIDFGVAQTAGTPQEGADSAGDGAYLAPEQLCGEPIGPATDVFALGCLAYELHQSTTDPAEFMFYERWSSDAALAAHAASTEPHRALLRQQLGELAEGRPAVTRWRRVNGA